VSDKAIRRALMIARKRADGGPIPPFKLSSGAAKVIATKGQAKATPQQYAALPGIKPDEIKHGNLEALGTKALPREEVIKHLEANAVPLQETVYKGDDARSALKRYSSPSQSIALPGGKNYREVLLHLPAKEQQAYAIRYKDGPQMGKAFGSEEEAQAALQEMFPGRHDLEVVPERATSDNVRTGRALTKENFKSSHWDKPNVLAHIRMSDRKGPNNEKMLHVEELQSDWGQEGREKGFKYPAREEQLRIARDEANQRVEDARTELRKGMPTSDEINRVLDPLIDAYQAAYKAHIAAINGAPHGPYVDNTQKWTDLALKRVLHEAAHGGYDKVVFTPGEEQNKRYSLEHRVKNIQYYPEEKYFHATTHDNRGIEHHDVAPEDLHGLVGKELVERLLAQPTMDDHRSDLGSYHELEGDNLKVGGIGMRGYYDNIMPKRLQALAQQHDPKSRVQLGAEPLVENAAPLHSLDVTPQMRDSIKAKGFSQFKKGGTVDDPLKVAPTAGTYVGDLPLVQRHYAAPDVIEQRLLKPTKTGEIIHPYSSAPTGRSSARKIFEEQKNIQPLTQKQLDSVMLGLQRQKAYGLRKGGIVDRALKLTASKR